MAWRWLGNTGEPATTRTDSTASGHCARNASLIAVAPARLSFLNLQFDRTFEPGVYDASRGCTDGE
jgi:hypothetical protein